jgi:hypothetical protein
LFLLAILIYFGMNYFKFNLNIIISTVLVVIFVYALFIQRLVEYSRNKQSKKFVDVDFEKEFANSQKNDNLETDEKEVDISEFTKRIRTLSGEDLNNFLNESLECDKKIMEESKANGKQLDIISVVLGWIDKYFYWVAIPVFIYFIFIKK